MIKILNRSFIPLILILSFMSCTQERQPCAQPTIMSVILGCHQVLQDTGNNIPVVVDSLLPDPILISIDSAGQLVKFAYNSSGINSLTVHMSSLADSCSWFLYTNSDSVAGTIPDTINFYYDKELHFLSNACGYTYFYNLKKVTSTSYLNNTLHAIDSVELVNTSVTTNVNTEHVKIFFHRH